MKTRLLRLLPILALLACLLAACAQSPQRPASPSAATASWDFVVDDFVESFLKSRPEWAVWAGRHEFDGQLPDWSPAGRDRYVRLLESSRERALSFPPARLTKAQQFEREHLLAILDELLFEEEVAQWWRSNPEYYSFALDPDVYLTREYAPLPERMRAYIRYARAVPRATRQLRDNLATPLPRSYVKLARTEFGGLASFYENDVPQVFASVQDATLQSEFQAANAAAAKAMRELDQWLEQEEARANDNFALGEKRFREMLWASERIDLPLGQLKAIAQRDLDRNLAALAVECARFAPGATLTACTDKARGIKEQGSPVEVARRQLVRLKSFVQEKALVTIPGDDPVRVEESPPYQRWNFAYMRQPGPYEKNLPSIYYISPPDPKWTEEERNAFIPGRADLLFTSVHEIWPGHFLQGLYSNHSASKLGRLFLNGSFNEGWAHYAEELMWEAGLGAGDPETHIGQLVNALLRNVRLVCAIGMHTAGMTVEECERLFREQAFEDPGNARQQAARGTFDPGYGHYTLGKLMIRKLRDDWTATRGGRAAWKDFHDQLLRYGMPPVPLVRRSMMSEDDGAFFEAP
jgi:uncharacterized protein (DUF885 family)